MKIINEPSRRNWKALLARPALDRGDLNQRVRKLLDEIKNHGDEAIRWLTREFDGVNIDRFEVPSEVIKEGANSLSAELKQAIEQAGANIRLFHEKQVSEPEIIETMPGVQCWRKNVAIEKVGLYIPGGTAPLFSTILMLAIPASIAGCKEIVLCTPPGKDGRLHPAILFAAQLTGITKIFAAGGVQAIGAMAYGTETIPQVDKIFGPGNQYVTCAKQLVQQDGIAIDMPAGPSEVCVLADLTADPSFVAADLLSQAEHGTDSQVLLVASDRRWVEKVEKEITRQLAFLPRQNIASAVLDNSKAIILSDMNDAVAFVNCYAAEHLIIACANDAEISEKINNAGSVFLGNYSPESAGDYASGTNHTLPTNGFARAYSGVSVDSFVKKITYQKLSEAGLSNIAQTVVLMAEAEGLQAHANAVKIRLK